MARSSYNDQGPLFRDRVHAGAELAAALKAHQGKNVLVLGIPRGGVPVAAEVARRIGGELDVIVARKLGAPGYPELAIGAVTPDGSRFLNEDVMGYLSVPTSYLEASTSQEVAEARRRQALFRGSRAALRVKDRVVLVVDDGLATGATMRVAVQALRKQRPARLIVAVPVGSREACAALAAEADQVVCLYQPEPFHSIGRFYEDFCPTENDEVRRLLEEARPGAEPAEQRPS